LDLDIVQRHLSTGRRTCHAKAKLGLNLLGHESSTQTFWYANLTMPTNLKKAAFIHKNSSIHSYFRQLYIGKTKKSTPKKTKFVFHLPSCWNIIAANSQTNIFSLANSRIESGSVLPLAVVEPT